MPHFIASAFNWDFLWGFLTGFEGFLRLHDAKRGKGEGGKEFRKQSAVSSSSKQRRNQ
jgi:hypothetical protein